MDNTFTFILNISCLRLISLRVVADRKALEIHDDIGHILLDTRDRAELMENAFNLNLTNSCARKRRKHNSSQRVAERYAIASLKRFNDKASKLLIRRKLFDCDLRFVKIKHLSPSLTFVK